MWLLIHTLEFLNGIFQVACDPGYNYWSDCQMVRLLMDDTIVFLSMIVTILKLNLSIFSSSKETIDA